LGARALACECFVQYIIFSTRCAPTDMK